MRRRMQSWLDRFKRDEEGGILILSLFLFMLMVAVGGMAVDIAQYERTRTHLQSHLDNAVLAATSLSQEIGSEEVVRSYLDAAGLSGLAVRVAATNNMVGGELVERTVTAQLGHSVRTHFLHMFGYDTLGLDVQATATESVDDVEISLVLDVSGSMGMNAQRHPDDRKIRELRLAATAFVEKVLGRSEDGQVSISLVPYATKVNAGRELLGGYTTTQEHDFSHCVDFEAADYRSAALSPSRQLQRTAHFRFPGNTTDPQAGPWTCRIDDGFTITPLSNSIPHLSRRIAALQPEGNTSIDTGLKWGLALLDASAQGPVSRLIPSQISRDFKGRPLPMHSERNLKVLVLMTDGENTDEYRLNPDVAAKVPSNTWRMTVDNTKRYYSLHAPETATANDTQLPEAETYFHAVTPFHDRVWDNATLIHDPRLAAHQARLQEARLDWPTLWQEMSPLWYAHNIWAARFNSAADRQKAFNDGVGLMFRAVGPTEKDRRLQEICSVAQASGVVVFTIGFEVDNRNSLNLLKSCASTEAHYFDVQGTGLSTAFDMIASSISMLRLSK